MPAAKRLVIDPDATDIVLQFGAREVRLTNLPKLFWKNLKITKRDLLQYYADISPYLLPHLAGLKNEVVMPRQSRNVYDHAIRMIKMQGGVFGSVSNAEHFIDAL